MSDSKQRVICLICSAIAVIDRIVSDGCIEISCFDCGKYLVMSKEQFKRATEPYSCEYAHYKPLLDNDEVIP